MKIKASGKFEQLDDWQTPPEIIKAVKTHMGISFDCAASSTNAVASRYFTAHNSFLSNSDSLLRKLAEDAPAWCNPPFSLADEFFERIAKSGIPCVAIYKATNQQSKTWQDTIYPAVKQILMIKGRTAFINPETGKPVPNPPFNSCLLFFNCECGIPPDAIEGVLTTPGAR